MKKYLLILLTISLILPITASAATSEPISASLGLIRPTVRIFNPISGVLEKEFYPFSETSQVQGVNIASGDINGDGLNEIVVAAGRNEKPLIRIFNNKGEFINEFEAYRNTFSKGVKVAVAKLYLNQSAVIITAPYEGGGAHIKIFNDKGLMQSEFFSEESTIYSGANISTGDINKDGIIEIIVGSGYPSEPYIKIFDNYGNFIKGFSPFDFKIKTGVTVLAADINSDGVAEIMATPYLDANSEIRIFNSEGTLLNKFTSYPKDYFAGINLASSDIDKDKTPEIITGSGYGLEAEIKSFTPEGLIKANPIIIAFPGFKGGISLSSSDLDNDGQIELLAGMQTISTSNKYDGYKIIEVDIAKQRMFTYFKGLPVKQFIVSTGKNQFPTPKGNFKVNTKVVSATMARNYGPGNPNNYNLPNVPSIMYFYRDYAIHGAYWHWKFGTRVSHGCVNLKLPDAKWLYEWSNISTPVNIYSSKP